MKVFFVFTGIFFCLQVFAQNDMDSTMYYVNKGQFAKALSFAKKNIEEIKDTNNEDSAYMFAACSLAGLYSGQVQFDSAFVYYKKACEGIEKRYGSTSAEYGDILVSIATTYNNLGYYQEAEQQFQKANAILKPMGTPYYKSAYTKCLIEHTDFYILTGSLNKAEELCLEASKIALREPTDLTSYILAQELLAKLYGKMGFYAKQEAILMRIFEIQKEIYGEKSPKYANAIAGLADVYRRNQNLEKADSMYRKALEIKVWAMGKGSAATIGILNHLGMVNMEMTKYGIAEKYLKEALEIVCKSVGGEESALYPYCAKNLARLYVLSGRKKLAEPLFQKCLTIYNKMGLELNSGRLSLLHDMAELLYAGDPAKAAIYLKAAMVTENKLLLKKLDFLSETELLAYLKGSKDVSDIPYQFLMHYKNPLIAGEAYNSKLLLSGIGLQNSKALYQSMAQSKDSELTILWKNYLQQKSSYTYLSLTPVSQRNTNMDSVAAILNQQEKDLLRRSAYYRSMKEKLSVKWQDVRKHLRNNEASIEFVRFNYKFDTYNTQAGPVYYAALLLRPQDAMPQFIVLCKEKQLIDVMKKFPYKAAVNSRGAKAAVNEQIALNTIYKLVWQPLESHLIKTKTVYFSPDGILHRVAFAAIPYKNGTLLSDKYHLVQLTSTRQVALQETKPPAPVSIAMFGGINYSHQSAYASFPVSPDPYAYVYRENRGTDVDSFRFLPNTLKEVNEIKADAEYLKKRFIVFTGDNATEAAFRSLGGDNSPEIIHFATHGFTLPDTTQRNNAGASFKASDNPLLRCGLVMAGGNKGWEGKASANEDDGILTGMEISSIQLPHTQLAVLSACETGLGKIEGSEGVFGLQRAFKLAGVNYVMASLWQVPDKETAEFMELFYAQWFDGKTIREAFLNTQQIMRKKYAPYYWAGFTLVQ